MSTFDELLEIKRLMREIFDIKKEQSYYRKRIKEINHEHCTKMMNGYQSQACLNYNKIGELSRNACDNCRVRHDLYLKRIKNSREITILFNKLRNLVMK